MTALFFLGRLLRHCAESYATKQGPSSVEGAEAEAVDRAGAAAEVEVEAEVEATLISSEEAVMSEAAAAVVTSSTV